MITVNNSTVKYLIGSAGPSGFGSKTTAEEVTAACSDLSSITAIITGATSGIGGEIARVLVKRGVRRLILPVRNLKKAEERKAHMISEYPKSEIIIMPLDLSSLTSVRSFVSRFLALDIPINLLINNAGIYSHRHKFSEDGVERTFATNYLGHFLLTKLLLEKMAETAKETGIEGRIVNISSSYHTCITGDEIQYLQYLNQVTSKEMPYDAVMAYSFSKLAVLHHTKALSDKIKKMNANLTVNCVNPGRTKTKIARERDRRLTDMVYIAISKFIKTLPQAAATPIYVAVHPTLAGVSGKYFADCNETTPSKLASSYHLASTLWKFSNELSW